MATWKDADVREGWARIGERGPFVYGLTNYIAANLSANEPPGSRRVEARRA